MGFFSFFSFFKKKPLKDDFEFLTNSRMLPSGFFEDDYLGLAADAGHKAKEAVKNGKYDEAWGLYHEQKSYYVKHANRSGYTVRQALALDASVHENMADILRREGKHLDALVDVVYWVMTGADRPIKRHDQKLKSYFNRCKFKNTTVDEARLAITTQNQLPEFTLARSVVAEWHRRG